tara:strand:+ start:231 stop:533 length:303 start_codon:yes stop_codon:yes gene_type:complete
MAEKWTHKMVNGQRVDLSAEEVTELKQRETEWIAAAPARAFASLRDQRDRLLADTDWMALPDSPAMSDAWTKYRADLRALPAQYDDESILGTITFPTPPS